MIVRFQNNICLNYLVDPHVISLINMGIDLKEYFESDLSISKINDERFPNLHRDPSTKIIGLNAKYPQEILTMYDSMFSTRLH